MTDHTATASPEPDIQELLGELQVPFTPDQVHWRVMNTSRDKKRGQIVPYADPRAYTDRLNALFSPQGWTREYRIETMGNITRVKKGESIISGKVLVTCTVTIVGFWSHSGTGEEWADEDNGMTSADAQAFKRACSCFGLGRYLYDFIPIWVDLDENRQPMRRPLLPAWAIPENWRKGIRPRGKNGNSRPQASSNVGANGNNGAGHTAVSQARPSNDTNGQASGTNIPAPGDGQASAGKTSGGSGNAGNDLEVRILGMEKVVGSMLYRNILREYGRVNQPQLIPNLAAKWRVLQMLESAARGLRRLDAATEQLDANTVESFLSQLQAPPLAKIADIATLQKLVLGLEQLASLNQRHSS